MTLTMLLLGATCAAVLIPLLLATYIAADRFRIWPTPGEKSWQSRVFWPLFRLLNVAAIAAAICDREPFVGLPTGLRIAGAIALGISIVLYGYALMSLGKRNTYCARGGLNTAGIYRWTRNPQYATVIPLYVFLAVAADSGPTTALCGALIAVYVLMALVEEPWLDAAYGAEYRRYRARVPRFFGLRRPRLLALVGLRRLIRMHRVPLALHVLLLDFSTGSFRRRLRVSRPSSF